MKEIKKVSYERLHLHITRKCNLSCKHCYCGKAQNIDMSKEVIDRLAETTSYINKLYLLGGELSLCVDTIEYLLDALKKNKVAIHGIRFSTNAADKSARLCSIINRFAEYVTVEECDCEPCKIFVSTDHIHRASIPNLEENIKYYQKNCNFFYRFVDGANDSITYEGSAIEHYSLGDAHVKDFRIKYNKINFNNSRHILDNSIMINVFGDVFPHTVFSYNRQDNGKYAIANIMKDNLIERLEQYNAKKEVLIFNSVYQELDNYGRANRYITELWGEYMSKEEALSCYDRFQENLKVLEESVSILSDEDAIREYDLLIDILHASKNEHRENIADVCDYIDDTLSDFKTKTRKAYPYLEEKYLSELFNVIDPYIMNDCRMNMKLISGLMESEISDLKREVNNELKKIEDACAMQNYENQFKDHEITHNKYPQFTPKDCIMWDNSMKHLADKKGIVWKDKTIRQRHIDVIEKMKKEKLSPREARLVRVS